MIRNYLISFFSLFEKSTDSNTSLEPNIESSNEDQHQAEHLPNPNEVHQIGKKLFPNEPCVNDSDSEEIDDNQYFYDPEVENIMKQVNQRPRSTNIRINRKIELDPIIQPLLCNETAIYKIKKNPYQANQFLVVSPYDGTTQYNLKIPQNFPEEHLIEDEMFAVVREDVDPKILLKIIDNLEEVERLKSRNEWPKHRSFFVDL